MNGRVWYNTSLCTAYVYYQLFSLLPGTLLITIIVPITLFFRYSSLYGEMMNHLAVTIDPFTNWLFVMFCFKEYQFYYDKLWGSLHGLCSRSFSNSTMDEANLAKAIEMDKETASPTSTTVNPSNTGSVEIVTKTQSTDL